MNHFSLNLQPSDTLWYTPMSHPHHQQQQLLTTPYPFFHHNNNNNNNNNNNQVHTHNCSDADSDNTCSIVNNPEQFKPPLDKDRMFEKPLTPSDVGKLNRLVIPKQHAEKYFPLSAAAGELSGGGLLLGFEDETGKCWRFRYSYWNSSQSYVLTKGWSRYVKDKKLDAGDVVLFERHRLEPDRFFIGWRRRGPNLTVQPSGGWTAPSSYNFINNYHNYNQQNVVHSHQISVFPNYLPHSLNGGTSQVRQKVKKSEGGNSRRLRLFGVNLECEPEEEQDQVIDEEPQTSDNGSSLSSQEQGFGSGSGSGVGPTSDNYVDYMGYPLNTSQ